MLIGVELVVHGKIGVHMLRNAVRCERTMCSSEQTYGKEKKF